MASLLGIDSGLTVTKAVVFDIEGSELAVARRRVAQSMRAARHVERTMEKLWQATAEAIREAVAASGRQADDIKAVGATAHGDGLYLHDKEKRPLGPGVLSLDSRAGGIVDRWKANGTAARALAVTGQEPHASAPSALLAWVKENEPERFGRIGHLVACKDWLRFCLTGTIGTDRTEASTSFTGVDSQDYSAEALVLYGLSEMADALPPIAGCSDVVGMVTREAAALTSLVEGTPVVAGLHDVTASALGIGAHEPGLLAIVVGTYSINEVVSAAPAVDAGWFCRNVISPGQWNNMAISPASTANYDWFLDTFCAADKERAAAEGRSIHELLSSELGEAMARPSDIVFHPFLFGSPFGSSSSAGLLGLHGWHDRGDVLKAVLEGIVFNHRTHVDALRRRFDLRMVRISGGGARNPVLAQLFADALDLPVLVTSADEAAAFGAALCAGAAVGLYADPMAGARSLTRILARHEPDPKRTADLDERYLLYRRLAEALLPHWNAIEELAAAARQGGSA
jgi:L-xylulokinase